MVSLESGMNIQRIFEEYSGSNRFKDIKLGIGSVEVVRTDNVVQFNYMLPGKASPSYKIVVYSDLAEAFYYSYFDNDIGRSTQRGREYLILLSRENHPEFFEWMLWSLL